MGTKKASKKRIISDGHGLSTPANSCRRVWGL